jgi:hypothetical protein
MRQKGVAIMHGDTTNSSWTFKGTWGQRFGIYFFSLLFGVLVFWLLGFITRDIGSLRGPDRARVDADYVGSELLAQEAALKEALARIKASMRNKQDDQAIIQRSTSSLQNTINQLLSIEKRAMERGEIGSQQDKQTLAQSQTRFMENQAQYLALNQELAELTTQQHEAEGKLTLLSKQLREQRDSARREYDQLWRAHRLKLAALKLGVMIPIFLALAWLFWKQRSASYGPIVCAAFIAAFGRVTLIVHEYFPREYFKYIALLVIMGIVLRILVYLIQRLAAPKQDLVVKQHRQSYDRGICPVCSKPIRMGALRYMATHKRTGLVLAGPGIEAIKQEAYTCPACGTGLYEKCKQCQGVRHSLLPFCEHCGAGD